MIPTVETLDEMVEALATSKACFIAVPDFVEQESEKLFREVDSLLRGLDDCPVLDEKTMFPGSLATNPGAKRRVVQRFVLRGADAADVSIRSAQELMTTVTLRMVIVAQAIIDGVCQRFGLSETVRKDLLDMQEWVLNVAHYPFEEGQKGKILFPAHKDWGTLAVYPFVEGEGLEASLDGRTWIQVKPPKRAMFCYAGDILQRVSPVQALLHRVVQPTNDAGGRTACIFYADTRRGMVLPTGETVGEIIDAKLRKIGQIS